MSRDHGEPLPPEPGGTAPMRAPSLDRLGEFHGSGLREPVYLVRRPDGQVLQLTALLGLVLDAADGHTSIADMAEKVSAASGRPVSPANVRYLLEHRLLPLGLVMAPDGTTSDAPRASHLLVLAARRTLIPPAAVGVIARMFAPLFRPVVVAAMLLALLAADIWMVMSADVLESVQAVLATPAYLLAALGITFASMVFHEWGHATACRYGGGRPGHIGCGFYLVWPALYTDVTDVYRLDRAGRLRTDFGGVYFNAVFVVALAAGWVATGSDLLVAVVLLVHLEALQQLLPIVRLDGYYILTDLAGVPDLFDRMRPVLSDALGRARDRLRLRLPRAAHDTHDAGSGSGCVAGGPVPRPRHPAVTGLTPRARIMITTWVFVVAPLLAAYLVVLLLVAPSLLATTLRSTGTNIGVAISAVGAGDLIASLASIVGAIVVVLPAIGIAILAIRFGTHGVRAARLSCRGRPRRAASLVLASAAVAAGLAMFWSWRGI